MRQQIAVGAYNRHTKKLGSKDWGVRCFENMGFEKLPQIPWKPEDHVYASGGVQTQKDLRRP